MSNVKLIAMYLPQYHSIPENDEFWGKGFTDWETVRRAKPLYKGHNQPRVPFNSNYYDLSERGSIDWQISLAKNYGIFGFGIYHYWFNNDKNLLSKPSEIILNNKDLNINFFFAWDNTSWKRSWSNIEGGNSWAPNFERNLNHNGPSILVPYILGNEQDWFKHYEYLRPFFLDSRYIKKENKPLFTIYHSGIEIDKMCDYWNDLSRKDGFDGIHFIFRKDKNEELKSDHFYFKYEPLFSGWSNMSLANRINNKLLKTLHHKRNLDIYKYKHIWDNIIDNAHKDILPNVYHGAFVSYDDTPRRGENGIVVEGSNAEIFARYLRRLIDVTESQNKEFVFLTAWNEWGEGAYLEPDTLDGFSYLESIKSIQNEKKEDSFD